MSVTSGDVRAQVERLLGEQDGTYDVDAVTAGIVARWGLVDVDDVPAEELWALVAEHDLGEALVELDPVEEIRAALVAAISTTPIGDTAQITHRGVEVRVYGASRVYHSWPQPLAELTIAGEPVAGESITSWADLAGRISAAADDVEADQAHARVEAQSWHAALRRAEREVEAARRHRDKAIASAVAAGVTPYRIAQDLGIAESTVGRLLRGRR